MYQVQAANSPWIMGILVSHSAPTCRGKTLAPGMEIVAQDDKPGLSILMENTWRTRRAPPRTIQEPLLAQPKCPSKDNPRAHLGQPPSSLLSFLPPLPQAMWSHSPS